MNEKLPRVFANKIDKSIETNSKCCVTKNEENERTVKEEKKVVPKFTEKNIYQKINDIFSSTRYVYKADVDIVMKDKTITKKIVGQNSKFLITIDNELIPIEEIEDIHFTQ